MEKARSVWNTESWLCRLLCRRRLVVGFTPLCVVRIRADGQVVSRDLFASREIPETCIAEGLRAVRNGSTDLAGIHCEHQARM